jgi:hypothetical protein
VLISGNQNRHKREYINQTQHKQSAGVKTNITKLHTYEALNNLMVGFHEIRIASKEKSTLKRKFLKENILQNYRHGIFYRPEKSEIIQR